MPSLAELSRRGVAGVNLLLESVGDTVECSQLFNVSVKLNQLLIALITTSNKSALAL